MIVLAAPGRLASLQWGFWKSHISWRIVHRFSVGNANFLVRHSQAFYQVRGNTVKNLQVAAVHSVGWVTGHLPHFCQVFYSFRTRGNCLYSPDHSISLGLKQEGGTIISSNPCHFWMRMLRIEVLTLSPQGHTTSSQAQDSLAAPCLWDQAAPPNHPQTGWSSGAERSRITDKARLSTWVHQPVIWPFQKYSLSIYSTYSFNGARFIYINKKLYTEAKALPNPPSPSSICILKEVIAKYLSFVSYQPGRSLGGI